MLAHLRAAPCRRMLAILVLTLPTAAVAWCGVCDNAPSRSWSWWFGFGECECYNNWSGRCCSEWSLGDWDQKVADWSRGESCEAQPGQACAVVTSSPASQTHTQIWKHQPEASLSSQSQCEASGCMWVECFPSDNAGLGVAPAEDMCSQCDGPWKGRCEWSEYSPGFLAFAGPGKYCGFKYPACPASAAKNCFCGEDTMQELRTGWCNNGEGMGTFCPNALDHGDGRTQQCSWNGWTISPQDGGDIEETCRSWGL